MRMYDIISRKRHGGKLSEEEIKYFVSGYTKGDIPDYQASALLMAIAINSMDDIETSYLTTQMAKSGDVLDLSSIPGKKVDKHSTGGVGDKTTLICAPITAACGVPVAKMSGKGLGHTGGTIDKLDSIPGFRTELSEEEFLTFVRKSDIAICGQSKDLAPCDKKLYALRDLTATVDSIPLIASSIMSKKIASGADCIVLDVKVGKGAFMKTYSEAQKLADLMCSIGENVGRKTVALISDMNEPLGNAIGNSLEVMEAIEVLKGQGPEDLVTVALDLSANMVALGKDISYNEAMDLCNIAIKSGLALKKLEELIENQGGNPQVVNDYSLFKKAKRIYEFKSRRSGVIKSIDSYMIGKASCLLGAGRITKDGDIDPSAGIRLIRKSGDQINEGECLALLYTDIINFDDALEELNDAWKFFD